MDQLHDPDLALTGGDAAKLVPVARLVSITNTRAVSSGPPGALVPMSQTVTAPVAP